MVPKNRLGFARNDILPINETPRQVGEFFCKKCKNRIWNLFSYVLEERRHSHTETELRYKLNIVSFKL